MKKRIVPVIQLQKQKIARPEEIWEPKKIDLPMITTEPQISAGSSREAEPVMSSNLPTQQLRRSERFGTKVPNVNKV